MARHGGECFYVGRAQSFTSAQTRRNCRKLSLSGKVYEGGGCTAPLNHARHPNPRPACHAQGLAWVVVPRLLPFHPRRRQAELRNRPFARLSAVGRVGAVIVALHVATGAAAGAASGSRLAALLLGPILHLAGDRLPHQDIRSRRFEIGSGLAGVLLLAARRGPLDPATLGAVASSAPDLEHVLPFLRPGGRKLFHDRLGWHRSGRFPAALQLLLAVAILGALI